MQVITLDAGEAEVFSRAALALKYDDPDKPRAYHRESDPDAASV